MAAINYPFFFNLQEKKRLKNNLNLFSKNLFFLSLSKLASTLSISFATEIINKLIPILHTHTHIIKKKLYSFSALNSLFILFEVN